MARQGGIFNSLVEAVQERVGVTPVDNDRLQHLELVEADHRAQSRELDLLGWTVTDYLSGNEQEVTAQSRRKMAQKARTVWRQDPQAGASIDLLNSFTFGRGVPKPRCRDEEVQKVVDEAWDDPDNQLVLTSYDSQVALGTDLQLQSNLFLLIFKGEDGRVKLGMLKHDEVENVVRDPDNRLRVLYYVAKHRRAEWDFNTDQPKVLPANLINEKPTYYEHWRNVDDLREQKVKFSSPPSDKKGEGQVYHIAVNRTTEQAFGVPTMQRLIRWFSAYNDFMAARVDKALAEAAFIMRRKIKGTPSQVAKLAAKAISRQSELAGATGVGDNAPQSPPRSGSILTENENVTHESLKLDSGAGNASQDAQMLRSQISAATHFPQHYLGDAGSANLATATSMELPVLKHVEARQETFEQVFRWFIDSVIEHAVDKGRLDPQVAPDPAQAQDPNAPQDAGVQYVDQDGNPVDQFGNPLNGNTAAPNPYGGNGTTQLQQGYDGKMYDEAATDRDLSYEFSMPPPLRRTMVDLVNSVANIAKTFDPNGTNMELSRALLGIALGEGLEVADPKVMVDDIFPQGYQDPALAAYQQQSGGGAPRTDPFQPDPNNPTSTGADGQQNASDNPYGAPMQASTPDNQPVPTQQATVTAVNRFGTPLLETSRPFAQLPEDLQARAKAQQRTLEAMWAEDVESVVTSELGRLLHTQNGN